MEILTDWNISILLTKNNSNQVYCKPTEFFGVE